jgi:hypothetical protein
MQTAQFSEASVRTRLVFGLTLSAHGAQKLVGWVGGDGLTSTGGFFELLGFRLLGSVGPALMLSVMIVAAGAVRWPRGCFAATYGIELLRGGGCRIPAK